MKEIQQSITSSSWLELLDDTYLHLRLRHRQRQNPAARRVCTEGERADNQADSQYAPKRLPWLCSEGLSEGFGFKSQEEVTGIHMASR